MRVLLKDGSVLEQGKWKQTDVAIENGVIVAVGNNFPFRQRKCLIAVDLPFFPALWMCMCICVSRDFLIRRPLRPAARRVRTADIRPSARCRI